MPAAALHCFVLRPPGSSPALRFWLHWPGLAVSNLDLTASWCAGVWGDGTLGPSCATIRPRNNTCHVPMYGCCVGRDEEPMLVRWVIAPDNAVHPMLEYLGRGTDGLHEVLFIGGGRRWPPGPLTAPRIRTGFDASHRTEPCAQRLLPLVCSINPMGTPCRRFAPSAQQHLRLDAEGERLERMVRLILQHLEPECRNTQTASNEVGALLYAATRGADWAREQCTGADAHGWYAPRSADRLVHDVHHAHRGTARPRVVRAIPRARRRSRPSWCTSGRCLRRRMRTSNPCRRSARWCTRTRTRARIPRSAFSFLGSKGACDPSCTSSGRRTTSIGRAATAVCSD